ncbi:MAG: CopD family protein [Phenylobacterium sp.]|jgi:protoporphyrinogen IX oxidase|uniref:CopD family protein n=1 Tax=Phenylobacterium sp. TaxID=1871053 RepID=UPI00391AA187
MGWLKALHIAGLIVWCAGLIYLPGLLLGHRRVADTQDFARVRRASRFAYTAIVSPAAFVAVGAGMALLFVADALHGWMFVKLALVSVLTGIHVHYGYILDQLSDQKVDPPRRRLFGLFAGQLAVIGVILFLVLAEPPIATEPLPHWLTTPGALQSSSASITPI